MPTIIRMEVELEIELYHSPPEPDSGYRGNTEVEKVELHDPYAVLQKINSYDSDELLEAIQDAKNTIMRP